MPSSISTESYRARSFSRLPDGGRFRSAPRPARGQRLRDARPQRRRRPVLDGAEPQRLCRGDRGAERADPTALPQTCQLLTADEVKALTGIAVEEQSPSDEDGKRGCEWTLGLKHLVVELGVTSEATFKDEAEGYQAVDGVGDQAYSQRALLFARKGTTSIYVDAPGEDDARQLATARKVAVKVIEKLGS